MQSMHCITGTGLRPDRNDLPGQFIILFLLCLLICVTQVSAQPPLWSATSALSTPRFDHTSTLLANGKVLVVGGFLRCAPACQATNTAELYDPATGAWSSAGTLPSPLSTHAAVRLLNGKVLVISGFSPPGTLLNTSYLYDPDTGAWTPTGNLITARQYHTATLLPNGKVLVTGGLTPVSGRFTPTSQAEIYDPATGTWSTTGSMNAARFYHAIVVLPNGKVLAASGSVTTQIRPVRSCEIFDPATGDWSFTGEVELPRSTPTATLLPTGKVLLAGGTNNNVTVNPTNTAELYDPTTGQWSATGNLSVTRDYHTATLLSNGKVLLAGGYGNSYAPLKSADLYDPVTGTWALTSEPGIARFGHTAILLNSGKIFITGGADNYNAPQSFASAEIYDSRELIAVTVSAASYSLQIAGKKIVAAFGQNFSAATEMAAMIPLPTSLAGVSVKVRDSFGIERLSPLFFVSPGQINYQIPDGTATGQAIITITDSDGRLHYNLVQVAAAAPAIFTVNQSGTGAVAAQDAFTFTPAPFNATRANGDPNILVVYGTGLGADATDADGDVGGSVQARIDNNLITVLYAGRAPGFVGLNQFNLLLPAGISSGTHTLTVSRGGVTGNTITLTIK